jgi:hypothetical protein
LTAEGARHAAIPALTVWQQRGWLRVALLKHYDDDDAFRRDLRTPALPASGPLHIAQLAARCGLDRIIADDHHMLDGIGLLRYWVYWARQLPDTDYGLITVAGFGGTVAEMAVEERIVWDPAKEPQPGARRRLIAQIDALLARGVAGAIENGYLLPDTANRLPMHVEWAYQHLRGRTYREIAEAASAVEHYGPGDVVIPIQHYEARGVAIAVRRMAPLVGFSLPGRERLGAP